MVLVLTRYITSRLRKAPTDGTLRWGWGLQLLGLACLGVVFYVIWAFLYEENLWTAQSEFWAAIALIVFFGSFAVYFFIEFVKVRGTYDDHGIVFHTPWTGTKKEIWEDLQSVDFSNQMSWNILRFRSENIIRLPALLSGTYGVIEITDRLGFKLKEP